MKDKIQRANKKRRILKVDNNRNVNITRIEILGERNSGTNYLENLLELNTNCKIISNQKHRRLDKLPLTQISNTLYIHISKDIFSWLHSMHLHPYHFWTFRDLSFDAFLLTQWDSKDLVPFTGALRKWGWTDGYYSNIFHLRAVKLQTFLTVRPCLPHTFILQYLDLNRNATAILNLLQQKFNIQMKNPFKLPSCYLKHDECLTENQTLVEKVKNYYLHQEYMKEYKQSHFNIIKHNLDYKLEEKFGYHYNDVKELWIE